MTVAHLPFGNPDASVSAEAPAYGDYLWHQLGSQDWHWPVTPGDRDVDGALLKATADLDLLVYVACERPWWRCCLLGSPAQRLVDRAQSSFLIVRRPRWPIRHILLIARAEETDWQALDWVEQLARPGRTLVSILPIVPPWPSLHRFSRWVQPEADVLLAPCTLSGALLARMVQRLHRRRIAAIVSLDRGEPDHQIREAVLAGNPDLVVIAAESHNRLLRWLCGELVAPLLRWIDRPVLIARAVPAK